MGVQGVPGGRRLRPVTLLLVALFSIIVLSSIWNLASARRFTLPSAASFESLHFPSHPSDFLSSTLKSSPPTLIRAGGLTEEGIGGTLWHMKDSLILSEYFNKLPLAMAQHESAHHYDVSKVLAGGKRMVSPDQLVMHGPICMLEDLITEDEIERIKKAFCEPTNENNMATLAETIPRDRLETSGCRTIIQHKMYFLGDHCNWEAREILADVLQIPEKKETRQQGKPLEVGIHFRWGDIASSDSLNPNGYAVNFTDVSKILDTITACCKPHGGVHISVAYKPNPDLPIPEHWSKFHHIQNEADVDDIRDLAAKDVLFVGAGSFSVITGTVSRARLVVVTKQLYEIMDRQSTEGSKLWDLEKEWLEDQEWESLIRAALVDSEAADAVETQVTATLLDLLAEAPHSLTILSYLRHCIGIKSSPSSSRSLVRPGFLARRAVNLPSTTTTNTTTTTVNLALKAVLDALTEDSRLPTYAATTQQEVLEGVTAACSILAERTVSTLECLRTPTLGYIHLFLSKLPIAITPSTLPEDVVKPCVASLDAALKGLGSLTVLESDAEALLNMQSQVGKVRSLFERAPQDIAAPSLDLDASNSLPDPDVAFLVSDLITRPTEPFGISNTESTVSRLAGLLKHRASQCTTRGSTPESALTSAFLEVLLESTSELRRGSGKKIALESFVFSRLPEILRELFSRSILSDKHLPDGLQGPLEAALRRYKSLTSGASRVDADSMEVEESSENALLNNFVVALCRQELVSVDVAASLVEGLNQDDLQAREQENYFDRFLSEGDPDELKKTFNEVLGNFAAHRAVVTGLVSAIESWSESDDLSAIAVVCAALLSMPPVLEIVFLHVEPPAILAPIRAFLEKFDTTADNFGDGPPIERYGQVVLFLEAVLSRFDLHHDLPRYLGANTGFFVHWLPSVSAVYPLASLDDIAQTAVKDWISALFGEGISDDLTQSTNPQVLLRVAPTICKQCLAACEAGVLDVKSLGEAFSYFLQDLLSFTLPGIINWLINEILRTGPTPARAAMYDILQLFIFSDTLPRAVLEIISPTLRDIFPIVVSTTPAPMAIDRLSGLIAPFPARIVNDLSVGGRTWLEKLLDDLTSIIEAPQTFRPSLNLSSSLRAAQLHFSSREILLAVLDGLSNLAQPLPTPSFDQEAMLRSKRLIRAGEVVLTASGERDQRSWPLLESAVREVLPQYLSTLASQPPPQEEITRVRLEALGDMIVAAFDLVLGMTNESGEQPPQATMLLDRLALIVRRIKAKRRGGGTKAEAAGGPTALDTVVDRFGVSSNFAARSWSPTAAAATNVAKK